jgi:iron complex outermembrane receptor protein
LPGQEPNWSVGESFSLYACAGNTFRVPTYTDLYYEDPVNIGSPQLKAKKAFISELGFKFIPSDFVIRAAFFRRNSLSIIDW